MLRYLPFWLEVTLAALAATSATLGSARAEGISSVGAAAADRLIAAYPEFVAKRDGNKLLLRDGSDMTIDDGIAGKKFEQLLATPDLKDEFSQPYLPGKPQAEPAIDQDPGRIRFDALFRKMYGDCRNGGVVGSLVPVPWLPHHQGGVVMATSINGVAAHLEEVSKELDGLPDAFIPYLIPTAGIYSCRVIAGTDRVSMHAYAAAIDLNTQHAHYWLNAKPDASGVYPYHNEIPFEIVDIFERHGFIWGGKWYHYDTMHFEYRPELITPQPAK